MPVRLAVLLAALSATASSRSHENDAGSFTIALGGDLLLGRGVARRAGTEGWQAVLAPLRATLGGADASLINLESPIGRCLSAGSTERPRLCGDPEAAQRLAASGITAVSLANNHALDGGLPGLTLTVDRIRAAGVAVLGSRAARAGELTAERLGPITILAANLSRPAWPPGRTNPVPSPAEVAAHVRDARAATPDLPILVLLHGGREMDPSPSSFETRYARAAVDAGAAAVVFHGAHVLHPLVQMSGVPVHLGLGNLLFDQHDRRATQGQIVILRFRPGRAAEVMGVRCVDTLTGRLRPCRS
jgi:poly-gamma-glutamate synthesis protein (capsule biosynthesis protein)